jgi:hypothetical protein
MEIKALQDPLACSVDYQRFPKHQVGPPQHSCSASGARLAEPWHAAAPASQGRREGADANRAS